MNFSCEGQICIVPAAKLVYRFGGKFFTNITSSLDYLITGKDPCANKIDKVYMKIETFFVVTLAWEFDQANSLKIELYSRNHLKTVFLLDNQCSIFFITGSSTRYKDSQRDTAFAANKRPICKNASRCSWKGNRSR